MINLSLRVRRSQLERISQNGDSARRICDSTPGNVDACIIAIREPIDHATAKGVVVVAAAGNDAWDGTSCSAHCKLSSGDMTSDPSYPASFENVISVGALDRDFRAACYSNFGKVDFAAPGGCSSQIKSTVGEGANPYLAGTSQAAPHIAGTVALLKAANPDLFPANFTQAADTDFYRVMKGAGTRTLSDSQVGYGRVDVGRALSLATGLQTPPEPVAPPPVAPPPAISEARPELQVTPGSIYMGYYGTLTSVYLSNRTGAGTLVYGAVTIKSKTGDKPWITVSQPTRNQGPAMISISVDRKDLATGRYAATLELAYQASPPVPAEDKKVEITVTMDVRKETASAAVPPASTFSEDLKRRVQEYIDRINNQEGVGAATHDYGTLIVVLQDPIRCPDITAAECRGLLSTTTNLESRYVFGFPTVSPGYYIVWAGSDDNGDGSIGGPGEFFGRYPASVGGEALLVGSSQVVEGLDISVSQ